MEDRTEITREYNLEMLGRVMKRRRKAAKLLQIDIARKLQVNEQSVSHWECGRRACPDHLITLFALHCGCKVKDLLSDYMEGKGKK